MKVGSLFSGGGLGDFGFMAAGMEIAWQCEIDEYCQKILELRYPESKKYRDIKALKGSEIEKVDIITGGFPCQPFSVAGKQKGKEDNRYLWPEMLRVIKECRPRWVVGENVPGIINLALDTVCTDLEAEGYEVWPIVFPSHALGARHKRDRLWIVAYSNATWEWGNKWKEEIERLIMADTQKQRLQGHAWNESERSLGQFSSSEASISIWRDYWKSEPPLGRVANGIADRVHRIKALGNGQVPACTHFIGKMIMWVEMKVARKEQKGRE
jgi:DNA (cytosine-5)-methyltransferase 1